MPKMRRFNSMSAKLTTPQVQEMYNRLAAGEISQGQAAREYGLGVTQVGRIARGESRAEETGANRDVRINHNVQIREEDIQASMEKLRKLMAEEAQRTPSLYNDPPPYEEHDSGILDRLNNDIAQHVTTKVNEGLEGLLDDADKPKETKGE